MRQRAVERLGKWINQKFRLDRLLGVGGMATVYAATHRNGSKAALKILHTEFAREDAIKQRFLREGYVANKVDHVGRVAILDDDETEDREPFLVMELLEGETLQQLWKRHDRRVPIMDALVVAEAVLDTLIPFHEQNIIHRDLKPANIFITHEGQVKLLDFGVAQLREQGGEALTRAGTALGTPSFMSPEQAMGKSDQLDGRSDVFAVGATLYAVLSGRRLHQGKSDNEAFILAATQPATSLARAAPHLPVEVIALVDKALSWDRRKRFANVAAMRDACRELIAAFGAREPNKHVSVLPPRMSSPPTMPATPTANRAPSFELAPAPVPVVEHAPPPSARPVAPTPLVMPGELTPSPSSITARPSSSYPPAPTGEMLVNRQLAAEQDIDVEGEAEIFRRLEKAFPALKHYGAEHPESQAKVRGVHRALLEVMREEPDGVRWDVHPFCFTREGATVWEPGPPLDQLPYNLASAGVEKVHIRPGVTEEELRAFLRAVVVEPQLQGDDGDIGADLWEAGLLNIVCSIRDDFAANDARAQIRFFDEADELEAELREELAELTEMLAATANPVLDREGAAEMAAVALAANKTSFQALGEPTTALWIEPAMKSALGAQVNLDPDEWRERFLDVIALGLDDAVRRGDPQLVLDAARRHAAELSARGAWKELSDTHAEFVDRVTATASPDAGLLVTRAMFSWDVVQRAFAAGEPAREVLANVLGRLDGTLLKPMLTLANELRDAPLELALQYLGVAVRDNEEAVIDTLDQLNPQLAQRLLAMVVASAGSAAQELLKPLLLSGNTAVRCEALALLAPSPDQLGKQLLRMLESNDAGLRSAALTTMLRHQVKSVGPSLVQLVEGAGFGERPSTEQRQIFETLYALNAMRAERLLTTIVEQHGMLSDEALDRVRAAAAEVLGRLADSHQPLEALENAARRRPWNTQTVRSAATQAIDTLRRRIGGPPTRGIDP
jgi:serine/threonine protein kinase